MTNLEYLEKMKKVEESWLDDTVIKNISGNNPNLNSEDTDYRKTKALEIIAEEKIKANDNLCLIITTLENIETAIRQRGL